MGHARSLALPTLPKALLSIETGIGAPGRVVNVDRLTEPLDEAQRIHSSFFGGCGDVGPERRDHLLYATNVGNVDVEANIEAQAHDQ